ncbi:WxL domain-containing protein [Apilactobacillus xinyiensis]|uniref:WxL domain-containing protein n=1 Tax=Apilactobacillus xinyiensis TaxID=2841032 RepID=UPI00200FB7C5|nr:WxL domain-containing protein [Apilactobacillus xinyiensis]MCL0318952.1 WxL domain-containing protein [Apilactobacillus xinyiensis]
MSLINKKNIVTMFAGLALLSASGLGGVKALADGDKQSTPATTTPSTSKTQGDSNGAIGQIDSSQPAKATANANMQGTTDGTSVSGKSDAHINVINGYLVLETVPSLGFEDVSGQEGNTKATSVKDNNTVLTTDSFYKGSQKPTELYVLDARSGLDKNGGYGYKVDAQLGNFGTYTNGTANPNTADAMVNGKNVAGQFDLNLSGRLDQQPGDNSSKVNDNANLTSDGNTSVNVLTNSATSQASGATKVSFGDNSNNGGGQTTLEVPQGIQAGQYAAPITWTLYPNPSGKSENQ